MPKTWSAPPGDERMETVPCPLCGGPRRRRFLDCEGFSFVKCQDCAVVFQNPRPMFEDLRRRYDEQYFAYERENERTFFGLMRRGLADIRFTDRTRGVARRRFLDVGCATGMLLESMKAEGWEVRGVDVCRESAEYGRAHRGVDIFAGTLEEARLEDGSFAVVHASHLIEHVPDPRAFLAEVRRVLAPGGFAIVTTPNIDGFQARLFGRAWRSAIADHLVLFSRRTLERLLTQMSFDILQSVTWGGLAAGTAPAFIKVPADRLAKRWGFGDVVMVLAARGAGGGSGPATS